MANEAYWADKYGLRGSDLRLVQVEDEDEPEEFDAEDFRHEECGDCDEKVCLTRMCATYKKLNPSSTRLRNGDVL